jgi:hypothetical protein
VTVTGELPDEGAGDMVTTTHGCPGRSHLKHRFGTTPDGGRTLA